MKKKLLIILMLFIGLFTITACGSKKEKEKEVITPLLYEVTKEGSSNKMYILGTMHIGNLKNTEFAEYVTKAFNESHYVAAETDNEDSESEEDYIEQINRMIYPENDSIKNHMSLESYNKLMEFVDENGLMDDFGFNNDIIKLEYYARMLIQVVIEKTNLTTDDGIDNYFINKAKKEGKTFMEVESSDSQEDVLASLPDKYYERQIIEAIDDMDTQVKEAESLFETWKKGNEEEIWKDDGSTIKEEDKSKYSEEEIKIAEEFDEKILYSRNITITDKFEEFFNNNYDMFFTVGQDHVVGPKGIVSYLRQRGYTVTKVS